MVKESVVADGSDTYGSEIVKFPLRRRSKKFYTDLRGMRWGINDQLVRNGILSEGIFNVAGIFAGISARYIADEERTVGLLAYAISGSKSYAFNFPRDFRLGNTDSQARQCHVFFIDGREGIVERSNLSGNLRK